MGLEYREPLNLNH